MVEDDHLGKLTRGDSRRRKSLYIEIYTIRPCGRIHQYKGRHYRNDRRQRGPSDPSQRFRHG